MDPMNFPFTVQGLTDAVNLLPNLYGRLNALNVFPVSGIATQFVMLKIKDGVITILGAQDPNVPPPVGRDEDERVLTIAVPHFPMQDTITPADLQGQPAALSPDMQVKTLETAAMEKLERIRRNFAITLEFLRMGALKGEIRDGRDKVLLNLYDAFGIVKKSVNFALDNVNTDVKAKCREVSRHIEDNLKGDTMNGVRVLVDGTFFDLLTNHASVKEAYLGWQAATQLSGDMRSGFPFSGLVFEEYRASAPDMTGAVRPFVAPKRGHAWPTGTSESFKTYFGPPVDVRTVNRPGPTEVYVSPKILDHGRGVEFLAQSNMLPICRRPAALVELTTP